MLVIDSLPLGMIAIDLVASHIISLQINFNIFLPSFSWFSSGHLPGRSPTENIHFVIVFIMQLTWLGEGFCKQSYESCSSIGEYVD